MISVIKGYRYFLQPLLGATCRFEPSCSQYAIGAIERFGVLRSALLITRRLLKCHPWHEGGIDPVPKHLTNRS